MTPEEKLAAWAFLFLAALFGLSWWAMGAEFRKDGRGNIQRTAQVSRQDVEREKADAAVKVQDLTVRIQRLQETKAKYEAFVSTAAAELARMEVEKAALEADIRRMGEVLK